jgi:sialic acid synthase SpsE
MANVGSSHYGSSERALRLITEVHQAGADIILFDAYAHNGYGDPSIENTLGIEDWNLIADHCASKGIAYAPVCWCPAAIDMLQRLHRKPVFYKLPALALTGHQGSEMIEKISKTGKTVIISTGMCTIAQLDEIMRRLSNVNIILMQDTNMYPTPLTKINLRAIITLVKRYQRPVGYTSHEPMSVITYAAVGMGAVAIEKNVILNDALDSVEDKLYSVDIDHLTLLVRSIHGIHKSLGDGEKTIYPEELESTCEVPI